MSEVPKKPSRRRRHNFQIEAELRKGELSQKQIAKRYRVSERSVRRSAHEVNHELTRVLRVPDGRSIDLDKVRQALWAKGWSAEDWAKAANVADDTARRLLRGKIVRTASLTRLLTALGSPGDFASSATALNVASSSHGPERLRAELVELPGRNRRPQLSEALGSAWKFERPSAPRRSRNFILIPMPEIPDNKPIDELINICRQRPPN